MANHAEWPCSPGWNSGGNDSDVNMENGKRSRKNSSSDCRWLMSSGSASLGLAAAALPLVAAACVSSGLLSSFSAGILNPEECVGGKFPAEMQQDDGIAGQISSDGLSSESTSHGGGVISHNDHSAASVLSSVRRNSLSSSPFLGKKRSTHLRSSALGKTSSSSGSRGGSSSWSTASSGRISKSSLSTVSSTRPGGSRRASIVDTAKALFRKGGGSSEMKNEGVREFFSGGGGGGCSSSSSFPSASAVPFSTRRMSASARRLLGSSKCDGKTAGRFVASRAASSAVHGHGQLRTASKNVSAGGGATSKNPTTTTTTQLTEDEYKKQLKDEAHVSSDGKVVCHIDGCKTHFDSANSDEVTAHYFLKHAPPKQRKAYIRTKHMKMNAAEGKHQK